jgi:threonine synthase
VSYLGLKDFLNSQENGTHHGIFFETAHPIKFAPTVESTLKLEIDPPKEVESLLNKPKLSLPINDYKSLKDFFLAR